MYDTLNELTRIMGEKQLEKERKQNNSMHTKVSAQESAFVQQKKTKINDTIRLLNYNKKMEKYKSNKAFEENLQRDLQLSANLKSNF